jgi:uncharacterized membrane protein YeaQ/YmgE (transglycosylase-associated protein family)
VRKDDCTVSIIGWIIIGGVAGWIAGLILHRKEGILGDIIVGIVGAIVGGLLYGLITGTKFVAHFSLGTLVVSVIGAIIVLLAVRLLVRWRRGAYHVHAHEHDGVAHAHLHSHAGGTVHRHAHPPPRSPLAAFLIGCLHGTGGSAAVGVLLVASVPDRSTAVAALLVFAAGTAVSMAALSAAFGRILTAAPVRARLRTAIPALGTFGLLFGAWYALSAWGLAPVG